MVVSINIIHVILFYLNAKNTLVTTDYTLVEVLASCRHEGKQRKKNALFHWILVLIEDVI